MSLSAAQLELALSRGDRSRALLTGWADGFLKDYGFDWVDSLDYADFEGAGYQWNLNRPLNKSRDARVSQLLGTIDLILDYGTSEHVFNPGLSFHNAVALLRTGGLLNAMLPACGYCDHGMYQFSPSFFYAIDRPEFKLERLYFFTSSEIADEFVVWDGLSPKFREHIHGAFDGSYAANCLQFLNEPILAWALFRKNDDIDQTDFMQNTQQLVYKLQWAGSYEPAKSDADEKLKIYNQSGPERAAQLRDYIRSISFNLGQLPER